MTIQQSIAYQAAVIASAPEWEKGESAIGNQEDLVLIADHYGVRLPACMRHFLYSRNPNHVSATGAHKTILKTLDKLRAAIIAA